MIELNLTPAQLAEIMRLIDLQPMVPAPPPEFFQLQNLIGKALDANPAARPAYEAARSAGR